MNGLEFLVVWDQVNAAVNSAAENALDGAAVIGVRIDNVIEFPSFIEDAEHQIACAYRIARTEIAHAYWADVPTVFWTPTFELES